MRRRPPDQVLNRRLSRLRVTLHRAESAKFLQDRLVQLNRSLGDMLDQGDLGSSAACALASALQGSRPLDRVYYHSRRLEDT